jgi:hypothetical protein
MPCRPNLLRCKLSSRRDLTPDESKEAIILFIYDPATPRERIDEDMGTNRHQATTQKAKKPWSIGIHFWSEAEKSQLVACAGFSHTA